MSELISKIYFILDNYKKDTKELLKCEENLRNEYNEITKEYRILFDQIKVQVQKNNKEIMQNCEHQYIRHSEYHNDRYFICDKCGHEKY
tara:strand:+ start:166 stop:432 length:267 start_codon:yes stop_codon:yes gene_type:complete